MKKKLTAFLFLAAALTILGSVTAFAAPPCPGDKMLTQPDGTVITATLHGDEWFHWYEATDGSVLVQGSDKYWHFGKYENGKLAAMTNRYQKNSKPAGALNHSSLLQAVRKVQPAGSAARRSYALQRSSYLTPPAGPEKLLVILVNFTDIKIQNADSYWSGKMFADYSAYPLKNDAHSSVNDYYKEVSGGKFYFTKATETSGTANDSVIRVSLNMAHPSFPSNNDSQFNADSAAVAKAALIAANPYINYTAYDTDKNGSLSPEELHISIILAGYEQSYDNQTPAVWGHSYGLLASNQPVLDGVRVGGDYTEQGEIQGDHPATIGILAHELGHSVGLPDLYDYGYDSQGVGVYSLMASGSWGYIVGTDGCDPGSSPTHLDAWSKVMLGFATPTTVTSGSYSIKSIGTKAYNVLKVKTTSSKQYFLLENRQSNYGYDQSLNYYFTTGGIAVYHIDESVMDAAISTYGGLYYINDDEDHKAVDIEEANEGILGYSQLDDPIRGDYSYSHLFRTGSAYCNSVFNSTTIPSSKLYSGTDSGVAITALSAGANTMSVKVSTLYPALTSSPAVHEATHTVRWTCSATGATGITYRFDVYQGSTLTASSGGYSSGNTFDWTPSAPGSYTIKVSVLSASTTVPVTRSITDTVVADTTAPVITAKAGSSTLASGKHTVSNVTVTAADPNGGAIASLVYHKAGDADAPCPADGLFTDEATYKVTATDAAGNGSSMYFTIDRTAPVIGACDATGLLEDGQTGMSNVQAGVTEKYLNQKSATKNGSAIAWPSDNIFVGSGVYVLTATDKAGNKTTFRFGILANGRALSVTGAGKYLLDNDVVKVPVVVTLYEPTWSVSVKRNGVAVAWSGSPSTFTAEGKYTVTATEAGGSNSVTMHFIIDTGSPKITAANTAGSVANGAISPTAVTVSATDASTLTLSAKKNGTAISWPTGGKFTSEGVYAVTATDQMGRTTAFGFTVDLYAPVITATVGSVKIANKGYSNGNTTVAIADVALQSKSAKKNGVAITWPTNNVFTGEGIYSITATDKLGRTSTFAFTIDKTGPAITGKLSTGAAISNGGYYLKTVTIAVSDTYLASKSVTKNGAAISWPSTSSFSTTGAYVVTAKDKAGNIRTFSFVIDLVKPVITVKNLSGVTIGNNGTAYSGVIITVTEANLYSKTVKVGTTTITWPSTNKFTTKGKYTVTVKDKAGNTTTFVFYLK